jgi:hypothetical protein
MRSVRVLIGLAGVVVAAVGISKLVDRGWGEIVDVVTWLVVGTVAHDGLLAPIIVVLGVLVVRVLPVWARMPVVAGFVVLGSATIVALPVLSGNGEDSTIPSLLDRNYVGGWLVVAALTTVGVAVGCWWQRRRLSTTTTVGHQEEV